MSRVFLASRNAKKLAEMQRILAEHVPGVEVVGLDDVPAYDEPVEDQPDFAGNALLKARAGARVTGLPSLADDSGLCVDALNGMPGVLSARWSGRRPKERRRATTRCCSPSSPTSPTSAAGAHFACAVALVHPDGRELVVDGRMDGRIIREVRGSGGFGYDVLFVADEHAGRGPHLGRARPGREGPDLPPGPAPLARDAARASRLPGQPAGSPPPSGPPDVRRATSVGPITARVRLGAVGEIRTLTGQDLNLLPLPLGYDRRAAQSLRPQASRPEVAAQLGDVAGGLDVVLRDLDPALLVDARRSSG